MCPANTNEAMTGWARLSSEPGALSVSQEGKGKEALVRMLLGKQGGNREADSKERAAWRGGGESACVLFSLAASSNSLSFLFLL
jgi:hypothetical protein